MKCTPAPTIRLAREADMAAIAAITNHYIRTTSIHFGYDDVTAAELTALWRTDIERYPWLVAARPSDPARHDGAGAGGVDATADTTGCRPVLGYAKAGPWRTRAAYLWTPEVGIYLHHEHRGRGLGRALYGRLLATLRAQGFHSAIAGATLPNDASVRLHESLGFVPTGVVRMAGRKFDRWYDVGFWQLPLGNDAAAPLRPVAEAFAAVVAG